MRTWTFANYVKFFTDSFNYSILSATLLLGVKATLVCLFFGYPLAWLASRVSPRVRSMLLFVIVLPILTSGSASTLTVVENVRELMPRIQAGLPKSLNVDFLFDQSVFVRSSIEARRSA